MRSRPDECRSGGLETKENVSIRESAAIESGDPHMSHLRIDLRFESTLTGDGGDFRFCSVWQERSKR
jgi:hypothetical protein